MPLSKRPSKKQKQVLDFILGFQKKHGYSPSLEEIADFLGVSIPTAHQHVQALKKKGFITAKKGERRSIEPYEAKKDVVQIPLMGVITAGKPVEAISNPEPLEVPRSMLSRGGRHYALKVEGESMEDEGIYNGDIIIVREQPTVENGESAVAYLPEKNEATLKKLYREKGKIRLQPANKKLKPFYEKNVEVQGKVIGILRKVV